MSCLMDLMIKVFFNINDIATFELNGHIRPWSYIIVQVPFFYFPVYFPQIIS